MPTYEYACRDCGAHLEVVQSFRDDTLTECPTCEGRLRKVFSAAGIIFKGSGYYSTDTRKPAPSSISGEGGGKSDASKSDAGKSDAGKNEAGNSDGATGGGDKKSSTKSSESSDAA